MSECAFEDMTERASVARDANFVFTDVERGHSSAEHTQHTATTSRTETSCCALKYIAADTKLRVRLPLAAR